MINLSEKDKDFIKDTEGTYSARGIMDNLAVIKTRFGEEGVENIKKEMKDIGYDIDGMKEGDKAPVSYFIVFLLVKKKFFNLDDEGLREMAKESAKLSFLLRFASRLLASVETICKNANVGWRKYYDSGELHVVEVDKEKKRIVGEVSNFKGHPVHCVHLEGYFSQIISFVVGKETVCQEKKCSLKNEGDVHQFVITWE